MTVAELLCWYAATAERWHDLRSNAPAANVAFDENARLARELLRCAEGRAGIAALIGHPASGVRVLAATHSLHHREAVAVVALEELGAAEGLHAIAARYALEEFRAGTLQLDG